MWVSVLNKHFKQLFLVLVKSHEREINGNSFLFTPHCIFLYKLTIMQWGKIPTKRQKGGWNFRKGSRKPCFKIWCLFHGGNIMPHMSPCLPCIKCSFRRKKGNFLPGMVGRSFKEFKFGIASSPPPPFSGNIYYQFTCSQIWEQRIPDFFSTFSDLTFLTQLPTWEWCFILGLASAYHSKNNYSFFICICSHS